MLSEPYKIPENNDVAPSRPVELVENWAFDRGRCVHVGLVQARHRLSVSMNRDPCLYE